MSNETSPGPFRSRHWLWGRPCSDLRYLVYCRAFALASASRLTLPDALAPDWWAPTLLHWLGAGLLAFNGCGLGWGLAAVGSAWPLLFLQDQLSQSAYLSLCAWTALACFAGSANGRHSRLAEPLPFAVRTYTLLVYAFAALHKLNRGYFDPEIGCANAGLQVLAEQASVALPGALVATFAHPAWPVIHWGVEVLIPVLLWWRPLYGLLLAAAMHLPLTIIFAPSFAFTVASGWVCFLRGDELQRVGRVLRTRWPLVLALGTGLGGLSRAVLFEGRWAEDPEWCVKELLYWYVFSTVVLVLPRSLTAASRGAWGIGLRPPKRVLALTLAYGFNALTPYLGVQFHHTAAMLSNLRIDQGCWNSLVFPERMRLAEPYVRLERLEFAAERATQEARATFLSRLWEPTALRTARDAWCERHPEPLRVAGSYRGRSFDVADFCAAAGWPLGATLLPGLRRFQVNVTKQCRQRCLH